MQTPKHTDPWSTVVVGLTFGLFALALFVKGFTHDLLLEAGVFLVSLKLILMGRKNAVTESRVEQHLATIQQLLAGQPQRNEAARGADHFTA